MPKLNLKQEFINKLNSLNNKKLGKEIPLPKKIPAPIKKTLVSSKEIPAPIPIKKTLVSSKEIQYPLSEESSYSTPKIDEIKFKKMVIKDLSDVELIWDSFDDNIKKIVINEIIEKYYFYKNWKLNSKSFFLGILFTFLIIMFIKVIEF